MNDRRRKGLEKEVSRIIGSSILFDVKNEKIKNLITVKNVTLSSDARYADVIFLFNNKVVIISSLLNSSFFALR